MKTACSVQADNGIEADSSQPMSLRIAPEWLLRHGRQKAIGQSRCPTLTVTDIYVIYTV